MYLTLLGRNRQQSDHVHVRLWQKYGLKQTRVRKIRRVERWKMLLFDGMSTLSSQNVYFIYLYLNGDLGKWQELSVECFRQKEQPIQRAWVEICLGTQGITWLPCREWRKNVAERSNSSRVHKGTHKIFLKGHCKSFSYYVE